MTINSGTAWATTATATDDVGTVTVRVPLAFRRRGGRKLIVGPSGQSTSPNAGTWAQPPRIDNALIKALVRAHRWKKLLDTGVHATVQDLAAAERINASYLARVLRLTLLAPEIVEAILDGRHPAQLQLADLLAPFPVEWGAQSELFLQA